MIPVDVTINTLPIISRQTTQKNYFRNIQRPQHHRNLYLFTIGISTGELVAPQVHLSQIPELAKRRRQGAWGGVEHSNEKVRQTRVAVHFIKEHLPTINFNI